MAQGHMDRLSALDVSFLTNESSSAHMHVGGVMIFEGPPPAYEDMLAHIRSRLHLVPRFRQKLAHPPIETGRPLWVDDPTFNLEYHVRHSALPSPGSEEQLRNLAARVFSQQLDRTKPLWELWLVQGLTRKRFAIVSKTHHALVDGVSGVDIATVLFDLKPVPEPVGAEHDWVPSPQPSSAQLAAKGLGGLAKIPLALARRAERAASHPRTTLSRAGEMAGAVGEVAWNFANPAPTLPLNVPIGSHRRFVWVRSDLAQFKGIKDVLGGTVNDVVLAVVAGGVRDWLHTRGIKTEGMEVRAQIPVSVRAQDEKGALGNKITAMRAALPVFIDDPVLRLERVRSQMQDLKDSRQALGAEVISRMNDFAPPTILAQAARINFSTRLFNMVVTNVPGPQMPIYLLGREVEDVFPVGFLPPDQTLFVAIMSYNGAVNFGLLADYDSMDDVQVIADGIESSLADLSAAADEVRREAKADSKAAAEA